MPEKTDDEKVKKQNKIQSIYALIKKTDPKYKPKDKDELATFIKAEIWAQGEKGKQNWEADLNNIDTSLVTDMSYLFSDDKDKGYELDECSGDIDEWDVSSVVNMQSMFKGAKGSRNTPLHFAIINGNKEAAKNLINAGADVKTQNTDNKTPIILELESKKISTEVLKLLINAEADFNAYASRTYTAPYKRKGDKPFTLTVAKYTPMWHAFETIDVDFYIFLLRKGFKIPMKDRDLMIQAACTQPEIKTVKNFDDARSRHGDPLLHGYAMHNDKKHKDIIKMVVMAGANKKIIGRFEASVLTAVASWARFNIKLMIKLGFDPSYTARINFKGGKEYPLATYQGSDSNNVIGRDPELIKLLDPKNIPPQYMENKPPTS